MNFRGYSNPLHNLERGMSSATPGREFRNPGMMGSSGLGSLHHTMPHLKHITAGALRLQAGGPAAVNNPLSQLIAASRPNTYNPDPQFRAALNAISNIPLINNSLRQMPSTNFVYAQGGPAPDEDPEEAMSDEGSEQDDQMRSIVIEALAALDGEHPDGEGAIKRFVDTFGPNALKDLQQLAEEKHQQEQQEGDQYQEQDTELPDQGDDDELAGAGGGLLEGPGTGQSDEIEGTTPSGRPVLLSDGEYVFDAPTVSALGDGSTAAGARRLDELRRQIRRDANFGNDKQAKPMAKGGRTLTLRIP